MLYELVKIWRGKITVVMTDYLPKVNQRRKTLLAGQRNGIKGQKVTYSIRPAETTEKFKTGPNTQKFSGGDSQGGPRRVKWDH